ncbi:MAG: hypothetical protein DMG41_04055 [Acidobacteria bacterium]|nr:MAG: hypothetical protein AUH13_29845 [Acidobacteria bacterium 13_2_20CM_58_27]PYT90516.1 MAG: hypothetical protein DMG41_04055 [Acidobacteriota bacterium]
MKRIVPAALSFLAALTIATYGQAFKVGPVRVSAGTVLTFYLHARLNTTNGDGVDGLPKGTLLRVKMLDSIDSAVNGDGTEFHGTVVSGLASSGEIVIHPDSEVRGILALLRSRSHPDGFRYELLITSLTDHGKSYVLTASLRPSLTDSPVAPPSNHGTGVSGKSSESGTH